MVKTMNAKPSLFQKLLFPTILFLMISIWFGSASLSSAKLALQTTPIPPSPTPLPDPLSTPLPTPGLLPLSAWRPPLYPIPWALTEHDHFYFNRPIAADEVNWPLPSYRYGGIYFSPDAPHTGVDITAPEGTPVLAAATGQIIWAGYGLLFGDNSEDDPYGLAIAIEHDFGFDNKPLYTLYAHLSEIKVHKGQWVETGETVALSGNTGHTTAPHLHFEVRLGSNNYYQNLNPELWLVPPQGRGVIVGRLTDGAGVALLSQEVKLINLDTGQEWNGTSYGSILSVNSDPFYNENFAISDLPAGNYKIQVPFFGIIYQKEIAVMPGAVSYFRFRGLYGFSDFTPTVPPPSNLPSTLDQ